MKTAIYIEDGVVQLVITPESQFEHDALKTLREKEIDARLFDGSFYDCRGGWVRQSAYWPKDGFYGSRGDGNDDSLILTAREKPKAVEQMVEIACGERV